MQRNKAINIDTEILKWLESESKSKSSLRFPLEFLLIFSALAKASSAGRSE